MAKQNAEKNKKVVQKPAEKLNVSTNTAATADKSQATPISKTATTKNVQEKLSGLPKQNSSEQANGTKSAGMDTGSETGTDGKKGNKVKNSITNGKNEILLEPPKITEKRNRIAKDVFDKNTNCKVLYFTADLVPFFIESDALRHGVNALQNKSIVTINRK